MELLTSVIGYLEPYGPISLVIIFLILVACGFGFPLPEDIPLMAGGFLVGVGILNFWVTIIVAMAGVLIGDGVIYFIGKTQGKKIK